MSAMKRLKRENVILSTSENPEADLFLEENKEASPISIGKLKNAIERPSLFLTLFQIILMKFLSASFFKFVREMTMLFGPFVLE